MNKAIKKKWIKALRSGEYVKGGGQLVEVVEDTGAKHDKFCCLGVICDMQGLSIGEPQAIQDGTDFSGNPVQSVDFKDGDYTHWEATLPPDLAVEAGLRPVDQVILATLNDAGKVSYWQHKDTGEIKGQPPDDDNYVFKTYKARTFKGIARFIEDNL